MNRMEQIRLAARLLNISVEEATEYASSVENVGVYVSVPVKGGGSIIVGNDGTVLYANSSVGYSRHVKAFLEGTRTDISLFHLTAESCGE